MPYRRRCRGRRGRASHPFFFICMARLYVILAPVQPIGWPMEIPLPLRLHFAKSTPNSLMQPRAWQAKASFSSMRPMSFMLMPNLLKTFLVAGMGPRPIYAGSTAARGITF